MNPVLFRLTEEYLSQSPSFFSLFHSSSPLQSLLSSFEKLPGEIILGTWLNEDSSETRIFLISTSGIRISRREEVSGVTFQFIPYHEIANIYTKSGASGMPDRICLQRKSGAETWVRAAGKGPEDETFRMVGFLKSLVNVDEGHQTIPRKVAILTLETKLLPPANNPRTTPFWTGYRAELRIPGGIIPVRLNSTLLLEKRRSVKAGDQFRCRCFITEEDQLPHHLIPGDVLYLEENKQRIGEAKILESSHFLLEHGMEFFQVQYELQDKIHQSTPFWHRFESIIEIKGDEIRSLADFYAALKPHSSQSFFKPEDQESLWKWLCSDLEQPALFLWNGVEKSAIYLKKHLPLILEVLHQSTLSDLRFRL